MLTKHCQDIEDMMLQVLRQAAADYTSAQGRFLPFAENRIHAALKDYEKALRITAKTDHLGGNRRRSRYRTSLDIDAIRRGLMMAGCV